MDQMQTWARRLIRYQLKNGLTVLLLPDNSHPVVAVDLWYRVGSKNEEPGKSGFAHLFEHMMFEGSENVGKAQHLKIISDVGGSVNGSTSHDRTNYWEVVPANQLELVLWLEADRMRSLDLSEKNFRNQRETVKEERRQRIDNQPYVPVLFELKDELAYETFPYKHSLIGSMEDLDNASLEDVRAFHDRYYRPNNAILSVVGDFEVERAREFIERYFAPIPAGEPVPPLIVKEPPQTAEKRRQYHDPFAPFPAYLVAYHVPGRTHPDFYPLALLEKILFDGESSRLQHLLVEEKQLALHLMGGRDGKFDAALFFAFAQIQPGHAIGEAEQEIENALRIIQEQGVTDQEVRKAKNKIKAEFVAHLETARGRADHLCFYEMLFGDAAWFFRELDRFLAVSREDIVRVARHYLVKTNRSVIEILPAANQAAV